MPSNWIRSTRWALYNRGLLRVEVRDLNKAADDFSKVLRLDPEDYRSLYNRALIYNDYATTTTRWPIITKLSERIPICRRILAAQQRLPNKATCAGPRPTTTGCRP